MKHYSLNLCLLCLCCLTACGGGSSNKTAPQEQLPIEEAAQVDTADCRSKTLSFAQSMGLNSPRFADDGFLEYTEDRDNISADPLYVAQEMYKMFCDDPTLTGVRIIEENSKETIAQYPDE